MRKLGGLQGDVQYENSSDQVWHGRCISRTHRKSRLTEVTFASKRNRYDSEFIMMGSDLSGLSNIETQGTVNTPVFHMS